MYFESFPELLHMDGHGAYVWSAYLVTVAMILLLIRLPLLRKRRALQQVAAAEASSPQSRKPNL
jgi:heme exporter protein D